MIARSNLAGFKRVEVGSHTSLGSGRLWPNVSRCLERNFLDLEIERLPPW